MTFLNYQTGFISSQYGNIGKTTNGGVNWFIDTSFTPEYRDVNVFWDINRVDTNIVYSVGSGGIIVRTTNSGEVWEKQVGNLQTYNDTYFTDVNTGYIVGEKGVLKKTTDAGLSWNSINLNTSFGLNKIFFANQNTGYICGDSGLVKKTTNAGVNWINQITPAADTNLTTIYFQNESTGYINAFPRSILKTINGGQNWVRVYYITGFDITDIKDIDFLNINFGICAADNGLIKTSDGGNNWTKIIIAGLVLNSVNYLDSSNIIAFGYGDKIIKSTDAGLSWFNINNQTGTSIFSSEFVDLNNGIICGDGGRIAKTSNGGINWTILLPDLATERLHSIFFSNVNTGYSTGQAGQIIKTTCILFFIN